MPDTVVVKTVKSAIKSYFKDAELIRRWRAYTQLFLSDKHVE